EQPGFRWQCLPCPNRVAARGYISFFAVGWVRAAVAESALYMEINLSMCLHRYLIQNGTDMCKMTNKIRINVLTWVILYRFGLPNLEVIAYTWVVTRASPKVPSQLKFWIGGGTESFSQPIVLERFVGDPAGCGIAAKWISSCPLLFDCLDSCLWYAPRNLIQSA